MRRAAPALLAALALAGCGQASEGLIPADRAERLSATLRAAGRATGENDCAEARTFTERAATRVARLPASVDDALVDRLEEGIARLRELVPEECRPEERPETTPETTTAPQTTPPPTSVPPPTTAPPTTAPPTEETLPPETAPVPTTPVPPEAPEEDDGTGGAPGGEGEIAP